MRSPHRHDNGFTLVELLIVIVIVAIILSVVTGAIQIFDKWAQK